MTPDDYMRLNYLTAILQDHYTDGTPCFVARHPQLPGCMSHGDTIEEAINNLTEARRLYIESLLEDGLEVPIPLVITANTQYSSTESKITTFSRFVDVESSIPISETVSAA